MTNIQVTPGSGNTVSTETIGGIDYQRIKVIDGTTGSTSVLGFVNNGTALPVSVMGTVGASIIGVVPVAIISGGTGGGSVSGTVGASIIGTVPVVQSGLTITSISGVITASISGTAGASVIGTVPVTQSGTWNLSSIFGAVTPYAQPDSLVSGVTSVITGTSSVLVVSAPASTLRNYPTHIMATNSAATGTFVNIVDNGQVIYAGYAAASGGGFSATLPAPLKQPTSGLALYAATTAQASVVVAISGFKGN